LVNIEDLKHDKFLQPFILLPVLNLGEHAVAPARPPQERRIGAVAAGAPQGGIPRGKYFILIEACACFL
jgi:hypothetical protein